MYTALVPPRHHLRRSLVVSVAAISLLGCASGKKVARENDRLRSEVLQLKDQLRQLSRKNAEARAQLRRVGGSLDLLPPEILASTPYVTQITIGRLSHARDEDGDGRADMLILYVRPVDELERFVRMVGHVSAHAAVLPSDADAITVGRISLGPQEVRQAYRSSFAGTHYTLTVPITLAGVPDEPTCIAQVAYIDARTGICHPAQRVIDLRLGPP